MNQVRDGVWISALPDPAEVASSGVRHVVVLVPDAQLAKYGRPQLVAELRALDRDVLHVPIPDFQTGTLDQLQRAVAFVEAGRSEGVLVHCLGGKGRSGMVVAAWLVSRGETPEAAIAAVREVRPGAVETPEQEARVAEFQS